ncbi:aldehyde dehydrogenase [Rhizodiscina lignyota]|uniref:succinate-semialdehyde dehydrogenase [NAD(P)(+)] n=1 Tax=Rhizodiscina lignyota TaxID=1504668 RepID=A0A9P4M3J5_9PEZI|nr:aldehyde dehydrogenase [Rhizodiscina lignyota]
MAQINGSASPRKLKNPSLFITKGFINGEWVDAKSGKTFDVFNPSTGEKIATFPEMDPGDVAEAAKHAAAAFQSWRAISPKKRADIIRKWANLMIENADDIGTLMTMENGKPFPEAKGEAIFAANYLEFYAGEAERAYGDVIPTANTSTRAFALKQPIGVVACLCPWNFPAAMITRKAGGALAAGCTTVVKPAGETPLTANAITYLAAQAGIPKGAINVIHCMANLIDVGKALCENKDIRKLSFTGSTAVGKLLMSQCSSTLKKLSMELGGNSPFIVFDDCPVGTAIQTLIGAKIRNSGQTCVSANRVYVQRGVYDALGKALAAKFKTLKTGDGFEAGVQVGPLTVDRGIQKVERHVQDAVSKGAKLLQGGKRIEGKGNFFEPSVLVDMKPNMISYSEEFFAPVVALYPFDTEEEVIQLANNADVGLGSYICTNDIARMWRVAERLETGMVGVNTGMLASGELPFGGVKHSGFGNEGGKWGVEEFMVVKTIVVSVPQAKI